MLCGQKNNAPPGSRTQISRTGILRAIHYTRGATQENYNNKIINSQQIKKINFSLEKNFYSWYTLFVE